MTPTDIARYYEAGTLGNFSTKLMNLISVADTINKTKISIVFPEYVKAFDFWFYKPEGWDK